MTRPNIRLMFIPPTTTSPLTSPSIVAERPTTAGCSSRTPHPTAGTVRPIREHPHPMADTLHPIPEPCRRTAVTLRRLGTPDSGHSSPDSGTSSPDSGTSSPDAGSMVLYHITTHEMLTPSDIEAEGTSWMLLDQTPVSELPAPRLLQPLLSLRGRCQRHPIQRLDARPAHRPDTITLHPTTRRPLRWRWVCDGDYPTFHDPRDPYHFRHG